MNWIKRAWAKVKTLNWDYLRTFEPTMLRAAWVALLGVAASVGIVVSPAFNDKVTAWITAAISVIAILQGLWTRTAVTPTVVAEAERIEALYTEPPMYEEGPAAPLEIVPGEVQDDGTPE
jgi:hypothetical protein